MLAAVALVGLKPWATDSVTPGLSVSPGIGAALGEATVVSRGPGMTGGVADAQVAESGPAVLAAKPVAVSRPGDHGSRPVLAVSRAEAVQPATTAPVATPPAQPPSSGPAAPPATQPVATAPGPPAPSEPAAAPVVVAGVGGESPASPTTPVAGGADEPDQTCEGDEYVITLSFEVEGIADDDSEVDILIRHVESDGSESEFQLQGALSDVRELIGQLLAEGHCVEVEIEPLGEDDAVEEDIAPGLDTAVLGETLEFASP